MSEERTTFPFKLQIKVQEREVDVEVGLELHEESYDVQSRARVVGADKWEIFESSSSLEDALGKASKYAHEKIDQMKRIRLH